MSTDNQIPRTIQEAEQQGIKIEQSDQIEAMQEERSVLINPSTATGWAAPYIVRLGSAPGTIKICYPNPNTGRYDICSRDIPDRNISTLV
jgi:hypothetical protein